MTPFATDFERLSFLLETEADAGFEALKTIAGEMADGEPAPEKRPQYITNYIGSKQKLVDWIWKHTPDDVKSVIDAFSGSAVVAYMYKTKGLSVTANDRLQYCYHAAKAIIENGNVRLSDDDLEMLLGDTSNAGTFVRDNFKGLFFENGVHKVIDTVRANIDQLKGYKKDMALFALGKTCMSGGFGHFTSSTDTGRRKDSPDEFKDRLKNNVLRINELIFDNGRPCNAYREDINEILPKTKADLAYFDPPYATEFSTTNYEKTYHFVEGLMVYWKGLEIDKGSKTRHYETDHVTVTKANSTEFFTAFLTSAKHIPNWLISYRDHAYPNEREMKKIISSLGRDSSMKSHDHKYYISSTHGDASNAKERLFVCRKEANAAKAADEASCEDVSHETDADGQSDLSVEDRISDNMAALADSPLTDEFDLLVSQAGKDDPVRVTGFMGSKYMMLGWIERQVPEDAKTFLDAFTGGVNVAYHFKRKGMKVIANDLLLFPYHIARAVIENSQEKLTDEDIEKVLESNPDAGTFIVDNFSGYYYSKKVLAWLDQVWANIQKLPGYKKDIALAALGNTVKAKSLYGQFHRSIKNIKADLSSDARALEENQLTDISISRMEETFKRYVYQLNSIVFDNGQACKAANMDAVEAVKKHDADVLYLDPPYITEFANNDYEYSLHFIEGLMNRWADKELLNDNRRSYKSRTHYDRGSIKALIQNLAESAKGKYKTVLMSYRDRAFPTEKEIKTIFSDSFGDVHVKGMDVEYKLVLGKGGEGKNAKELLFIAKSSQNAAQSKASLSSRLCHTSIPVDLSADLSAQALDIARDTNDPQFSFILCRVGTNKNGDHFTSEELSSRYMTVINKKIDLKHSQDLTDIVGGIVAADFIEDENGGRVECAGELYITDSRHAQLAYKLIKRGIITQVSMECDYEEGECSICGKRVKSKKDYCIHLQKFKGQDFQGKPVFEILHGVTFSGLGLLDRKGADENARITQVASENKLTPENINQGGFLMAEQDKDNGENEAAKKKKPDDVPAPENKDIRIRELEKENKALKQQLVELQKHIEKLEAEKQAAANRSRAKKLIRKLEKKGVGFGGDEDREKEIEHLAGLSNEAFSAAEAAYDHMVKVQGEKEKAAPAAAHEKQPEKIASEPEKIRSDAGIRPKDVEDSKPGLREKLMTGIMAAYKQRLSHISGEHIDIN